MSDNRDNDLPEAVATIGVFDGVHLGHQALIHQIIVHASRLGAKSVCVTFTPHPEDVLRPQSEIAHLAALDDRLDLLKSLGVSEVVVFEFTPALSQLSPEEFIDLLLARFRLRQLWIGSDFALGRNRSGSPERLAEIGNEKGFTIHQFPPVVIEGEVISSSRIRQALAGGRVEEAGRLLGRPYKLTGKVVAGDHRGITLGFPTANLALRERLALPADGIYAVWVRIGNEKDTHPGAASIGIRPTFGVGERRVEVYLIGFDGDLYGKDLSMEFVARLRGEERFDSTGALIAQMIEDVKVAKAILQGES